MDHRSIARLFSLLLPLFVACGSQSGTSLMAATTQGRSSCAGEAFTVDLLPALRALPNDTHEAQEQQLLDLTFSATLGRLAQGSSVPDLFSGVADQPLLRDPSLAHALRMPVGPARAVTTKTGQVIVLVQADTPETMRANALEAIDEESLALGSMPRRARVFRYELKPLVAKAEICELAQYDRARLESLSTGFRRTRVASVPDLDKFLSEGVDLLSARCTENGLDVTGRVRPRNARALITAEHIAPLAQKLGGQYRASAQFGASLDDSPPWFREYVDAVAMGADTLNDISPELRQKLAAAFAESEDMTPEEREFTKERFTHIEGVIAWKRENPSVSSRELTLSLILQQRFAHRRGFSLDPLYRRADVLRSIDEATAALRTPEGLRNLLTWLDPNELERQVQAIRDLYEPIRTDLAELRDAVQWAKEEDLKTLLMRHSGRTPVHEAVYLRGGRQCPRYDGPLAGTAAGMTFYYTDLLAKTSAFNWHGAAPESALPGFVSVVHYPSSTNWCDETQSANGRLWLGPDTEAFIKRSDVDMRFSPVFVRLYARASSAYGSVGEVESLPDVNRLIAWWNARYGLVADWEPQYEALNQLQKWSAFAEGVRSSGASCLDFMSDARVRRDLRFDRWMAEQPGLQWRGPLAFKQLNGQTSECLPLLVSQTYKQCGNRYSLSGGVSALTGEQLKAKPVRATELPKGIGRIVGDTPPVLLSPNHVRIAEIERSAGSLKAIDVESGANELSFKAQIQTQDLKAKQSISQRSTHSSWGPDGMAQATSKTVRGTRDALRMRERINELTSLDVALADLRGQEITVNVQRGVLTDARILAQKAAERMLRDGVALTEAAGSWAFEHEVVVLRDGKVAVHLRADGQSKPVVAVMASGGGNKGPPMPPRASFHIGVPDDGSRPAKGLHNPDRRPLRVWLFDGDAAENYIAQETARKLRYEDASLTAVKDRMAKNDLQGAVGAFERDPTPAAATELLDHALRSFDIKTAERAIKKAVTSFRSTVDIEDLRHHVSAHRVSFERSGRASEELGRLEFICTHALASRRTASIGEGGLIAEQKLAVLAPASYPVEAGLPPAVHARSANLPPTKRFVTRVVELSDQDGLPTAVEAAWGQKYVLHSGGGGKAGTPGAAPGGIGPAAQLFMRMIRVALIVSCDDDPDSPLPPCHERDTFADRETVP